MKIKEALTELNKFNIQHGHINRDKELYDRAKSFYLKDKSNFSISGMMKYLSFNKNQASRVYMTVLRNENRNI